MSRVRQKLHSPAGASMLLALLFLFFCMTVGAVVLTAASANAGRLARNREEQQTYLSVESAALLLRDDLADLTLTGTYRYIYETHYSYHNTGEVDEDGNPIQEVVVSHSDRYETGSATLTGSELVKPLEGGLAQLFDSTHPPVGVSAPAGLGSTFTVDAGEGLEDVNGTLTVYTGADGRYAATVTLAAADGSYPMTLSLRPVVSPVSGATVGSSENYTTTYTQTVTWQAAEIAKGGTP